MSEPLWTKDQLVTCTRLDDPDARFWAVDRLIRHFPEECCDAIAPLLLDDHDATPTAVARHLGEHGDARHQPILVRGFRLLRGLTPAYCLQALCRLGHPGVLDLAAGALKRRDLDEPTVALVVEALCELGTAEARALIRECLARRPELLVDPAALRGALRIAHTADIPDLVARHVRALELRGSQRCTETFRTIMDALLVDDASWCMRTGPSGRLELRKTVKAVESGYDCDILSSMGEATIKQIAQRFRAGDTGDVVRALADWTHRATGRIPEEQGSEYAQRIAAAVEAFASPRVLGDLDGPGRQFEQWLVGFQLSAAFAVARGHNPELALRQARGDLDRLLALAELETAHLLSELPAAIAVVCRDDARAAGQAQDWCLRMLEAQGPFFPTVIALETLGSLCAVHFIPEILDYLSDENSYVYGAAERALSKMGEAIIGPIVERIEADTLDPDAAHSALVLLCDLGTQAAYQAVMAHFDWFMEEVGPGTTAEWVSVFGMEDTIEPLRDWLDDDPAAVGQSLLLLGSIHNVTIPEEEEILRAIEDERERRSSEAEDPSGRGDPEGGGYLM